MKKLFLFTLIVSLIGIPVIGFAQNENQSKSKVEISPTLEMNMSGNPSEKSKIKIEIRKELKDAGLNIGEDDEDGNSADKPFMGLFIEDLTFPKAQALGYPENYGVLITGVVSNSPAWQYRLMEDDIIQYIGTNKINDNAKFEKVKNSFRAGEATQLTIWRSGEVKTVDFVFGSRNDKKGVVAVDEPQKKKKLSVGYGGGTWVPMIVKLDVDDVDSLMTRLGFINVLPDKGILFMNGIAGKINIGKGFFLGGQVTTWSDGGEQASVWQTNYKDQWKLTTTMGGVTFDKRFALAKWMTTSMGVMLGGSSYTLDILHSNGSFTWPATNDNGQFFNANNQNVSITRDYFIVQPRAELLVRFRPWLGIRGEAGYVYGYSPTNGWKVNMGSLDTFPFLSSPDTPYQGFTATIGPWFGF